MCVSAVDVSKYVGRSLNLKNKTNYFSISFFFPNLVCTASNSIAQRSCSPIHQRLCFFIDHGGPEKLRRRNINEKKEWVMCTPTRVAHRIFKQEELAQTTTKRRRLHDSEHLPARMWSQWTTRDSDIQAYDHIWMKYERIPMVILPIAIGIECVTSIGACVATLPTHVMDNMNR